MFFDGGTFWVPPSTYFYIPRSARAYLFPNLSKSITFPAAPLVLTPFVHVCVYIYIYIHMCIYIYIYIYNATKRGRSDVSARVRAHVYPHCARTRAKFTHVHSHTFTHARTDSCVFTHMDIYTHLHDMINTHSHIIISHTLWGGKSLHLHGFFV